MKQYKGILIEAGYDSGINLTVNIEGVQIPDRVAVLINFDVSHAIGFASVYKKDGKLLADIDLLEMYQNIDGFPSIGFQAIEQKNNVAIKSKLYSIGICTKENEDPNIKRLREQN
jgi:hypothetical protein